ncbi:MAG: hypothetical protein VKP72_13670 [bacterium]|nr:hypothetical protein [bacterium]
MHPIVSACVATLLVTSLPAGAGLAAQPPAPPRAVPAPGTRVVVTPTAPAAAGIAPTRFLKLEQARTLGVGHLVLGSAAAGTTSGLDVSYGILDNLELLGQLAWNPGFRLGGNNASVLTGALSVRVGGKIRLIDSDSWSLAAQGALEASTAGGNVFQASLPVTWTPEVGRAFHVVPDLSYLGAGPIFTMGVGFEQAVHPAVRFILASRTANAKVGLNDAITSEVEGGLRFTLGSNWTVDATLARANMVLSPFSLEGGATVVGLSAWYGTPSWSALRQAAGG